MEGALVLVHGGLYEGMTAERFWVATGVWEGLADLEPCAPDRLAHPSSWRAEAEHLLAQLPGRDPVHLVAGSNGCSTALRLALDHAARVRSLALCWPATAGDARIDAVGRRLIERTRPEAADALLAGETVRGVRDAELRSLRLPVAVLPAAPPDPAHPARTVAALADLIPGCRELAGFPLPFAPGFADALPSFRGALLEFLEAL